MQLLSTPSESVNQTKITEMSNGSCNLLRVPSIETYSPFLYSDIENPLVPDVLWYQMSFILGLILFFFLMLVKYRRNSINSCIPLMLIVN